MFVGIDDGGKVFIRLEVPGGHFTPRQFSQLITKMQRMQAEAERIKRAQAKHTRREGRKK